MQPSHNAAPMDAVALGPLFGASGDMLLLLDTAGIVAAANPSALRLMGERQEAPLVGSSFDSVFCGHSKTFVLQDAAKQGGIISGRFKGSPVDLELTLRLSPLTLHGREYLLAALREAPVSKHAADEDSLIGLEGLLGISHELRTPLNSIMGMAQVLMETSVGQEHGEYLSIVMYNARQLLRVMNLLLDLVNLEMGSMMFLEMPFSPRAMLQGMEDQYTSKARQKHIALTVRSAEGLPSAIVGDSERCQQLLGLLLDMALLEARPGSLVATATTIPPASVVLQQAEEPGSLNTACGTLRLQLDHTHHHEVCDLEEALGFSPPGWPNESPDNWSPLSGLEHLYMAVASRLALRMGGRLYRQGPAPYGKGGERCVSTVAVELPLQLPRSCEPSATDAAQLESPQLDESWRVLLVEDEPVNQLLVEKLLSRRGHSVVSVGLGEEAIARLGKETFDVVLMDLHMPGMNGLEVTRRIRRGEVAGAKPDLPVVALTIFASPADQHACEEAGMDGFVVKPFETQALIKAIQQAISHRQA